MANKFEEKKILTDLLNDLYKEVERQEQSARMDYRIVGEEQAKDWRTDELFWEDEAKTIPKMRDRWENVQKTEDELTEDDKLKIKVCQYVKAQLEKML